MTMLTPVDRLAARAPRRTLLRAAVAVAVAPAVARLGLGRAAADDATPESSYGSASEYPAPSVFVRNDPVAGPYLADPQGRTLYRFLNDTAPGESTCTGDCLANWPAFAATGDLTLADGVAGALAPIQRPDGAAQIAYNGIPLYHFAADPGAGDLNGEGIGGVWFVVAPGSAFDAKPTAAAGTPVAAAKDGKVGVTLTDGLITPDAASFAVGTAYTFSVVNKGALAHEFIVEKAGAVDEPLEAGGKEAELEDIEPGKAASLTWTFAEPGNYQLACHMMDHYQRGMATNIRVA